MKAGPRAARARRGADVVYVVPAYPWLGAPYPWAEDSAPAPSAPLGSDAAWRHRRGAAARRRSAVRHVVARPRAARGRRSLRRWLPGRDGRRSARVGDARRRAAPDRGPRPRLRAARRGCPDRRRPGHHLSPRPAAGGRAAGSPPLPREPIPRKPFYLIPGCYLGDVPPRTSSCRPAAIPARPPSSVPMHAAEAGAPFLTARWESLVFLNYAAIGLRRRRNRGGRRACRSASGLSCRNREVRPQSGAARLRTR